MKSVYAAIISPPENGEKYYFVTIPELDLYTQGENIADSVRMARDCIGLWGISEEDKGRVIPQGKDFKPECGKNDIVTLIDIDFDEYRKKDDNRTVRRNCSLPYWMDKAATEKKINVSAVLQEALRARL